MPDRLLRIGYRYHPVGQGLFASAFLTDLRRPSLFRWVYDCGTTSKQGLIDRELSEMAWVGWLAPHEDNRIELVTISHFDKDHISGLARLLSRYRVDRLLLPYMPLWSRLTLAFEQDVEVTDPVFALFVDPVGYILSLGDGDRIGSIVMIPPAAGDGVPPPEEGEPPAEGPESPESGEGGWALAVDDEDLDGESQGELMLGPRRPGPVTMLKRNGRLRVGKFWEFVPYNDAAQGPADPDPFVRAVAERRDALMALAEARRAGQELDDDLKIAVAALKREYEREFKDTESRNMISLFLYSGPLEGPRTIDHYAAWNTGGETYREFSVFRVAQLFTGDGYLHHPGRVDALERHLHSARLGKVGIFQVMHHGSSNNWYKGIAARIRPDLSVFSSDPNHRGYRHPSPDVLRDFWLHGPVQVDCHSGLKVKGLFQ